MGDNCSDMICIRPAVAADRDQLVAIDSYAAGHPLRAAEIEHWLATADVLVAERAGRVAGYAAVTHGFLGLPYLAILMISADARRQGIGRRLVKACGARHRRLWASTNESNAPMQRLLTGCGFRPAGRIEGLDPGDPELFYLRDAG